MNRKIIAIALVAVLALAAISLPAAAGTIGPTARKMIIDVYLMNVTSLKLYGALGMKVPLPTIINRYGKMSTWCYEVAGNTSYADSSTTWARAQAIAGLIRDAQRNNSLVSWDEAWYQYSIRNDGGSKR